MTDSPPTYEIRAIADFLKVPEDRLDACLNEFRVMLGMARDASHLLEIITDELTGQAGAVAYPLDVFNWIDDGEYNVIASVKHGDETTTLVEGTLRDDIVQGWGSK